MGIAEKIGDNIILIVGILAIVSFILAFASGILVFHTLILLVLLSSIGIVSVLLQKKASHDYDIKEIYSNTLPLLRHFGVATQSGAKLKRFFRVQDNKKFSSSGRLWDLTFAGNPSNVVLLVDNKTGKVVGGDMDAPTRESPILGGWKEEPVYVREGETVKKEVKIKEETKQN